MRPKAVAFSTEAKLMHRARELLVRLAKKHGVGLRQSLRGKHALIAQRYAQPFEGRTVHRPCGGAAGKPL